MEIIEIDDVIPKSLQNTIETILLGFDFPFYIGHETVTYVEGGDNSDLYWDKNTKDSPQFVHSVVKNGIETSPYWAILRPIFYFIIAKTDKEMVINRCKINLNYPHSGFTDNQYYPPHKDPSKKQSYTGIYYVNDCDGDTFLFEEPKQNNYDGEFKLIKRVTPKKGKLLFFPSNVVHCGKPPKNSELRCIVNFIMEI